MLNSTTEAMRANSGASEETTEVLGASLYSKEPGCMGGWAAN